MLTIKGINDFANGQWTLVLWPTIHSVSLANQIEFLGMFWWFDGRIINILYNQPFEAWVTCRQAFPHESWGESKKEEWSFLSLIHSEKFARQVTALFENILKFKSQLTIAFFAAVNHLNGPLRKQNFTLTGSKGHGLWFVIGGFRSVLCVSMFQGSLLVIVIMIDGSEKRNCQGGFCTLEFACLWKAQ